MTTPSDSQPTDVITRAFAAMRELPIEPGPTEAALSIVQQAVREAARREERPDLSRSLGTMPWTLRAAGLAGLAAAALLVYVMLPGPGGQSLALAQVAEKLRAAETLVFDSTTKHVADGKTIVTTHNYYTVPGKVRVEMQHGDDAGFVVFDIPAGKALAVSPKEKTAMPSPIKGGAGHDMARGMIDDLRSLQEKPSRTLGEKQVDGVLAKGFEIDRRGHTITLWADAKTGHPLRVEVPAKGPEGAVVEVITNFRLNEKLDPALFNVDPPEGYTVRPFVPIDFNAAPADHVVNLLRFYAEHSEGAFPANLTTAVKSLFEKLEKPKPGEPPSDKILKLSAYGAAVATVTFSPKMNEGEDWQYYPGATLGDKDRVVFWYRDRKSDGYRAVYGDLRIEEIERDKLPPAK